MNTQRSIATARMKILTIVSVLATLGASVSLAKDAQLDRTTLPIVPPEYAAITELDARDATPPPRFEIKAPKGAPNVVIVLIDEPFRGDWVAFR